MHDVIFAMYEEIVIFVALAGLIGFLPRNINVLSKNIVQNHHLNHSLDISQVFNMQKTRTNRRYHKH